MLVKHFCRLLLLPVVLMLGGCKLVLLNPDGYVARQQSDIMISTTIIIALIVVPVLIAIAVIAWRYRASNTQAKYDDKWDHSHQLELLVWGVPLLIIIAVGAVSWTGTHQLDPYRPLDKIAEHKPVPANTKPLEVEVVSLRWKWLFFYPGYGIATVNELVAPVDVPIHFKLTSDTMMDSFFIPALVGQVYTMPGMQTVLHGVINKPGEYKGFSANYSGAGFTDMRFLFHGMSQKDFNSWVEKVGASGQALDRTAYDKLRQPSRAEPIHYYAHFSPDLYERILNRCVDPGQMCMSPIMTDTMHSRGMESAPAHGAAMH
ncbi:ubiquinol oxidase subunit II [Paralcaligenes sp. KSB-10]|uniref:ubiquinol oxidase subunit II n=1 Tax=Paralcaligenes sp. KSB-10 TaxID=2901142 RepID=UPI001E2E444E|nr:ubiquinol oxidase subunit II [Paralcaligenes sp. KSB-10]UHL62703.1 ubiquinol oxidase subunit II [Paralcaligenes sp. KSB-10]